MQVAVRPGVVEGQWVIEKVIIDGVPAGPSRRGMVEQGGRSFHHESAWFLQEYLLVRKWEGGQLWPVYRTISREAELLPADENDPMAIVLALNTYFAEVLTAVARTQQGFLGPSDTHGRQGGDIRGRQMDLQAALAKADRPARVKAAFYVYLATFEAAPDLSGPMLRLARRQHAGLIDGYLIELGVDTAVVLEARDILAGLWSGVEAPTAERLEAMDLAAVS
jgi:hypothetical protein